MKRELLYPIFLECCKYTPNTFWKYLFEDMAYGTLPYGTYINKGFLCCNYKAKEFCYRIQGKTADVLYKDIVSLFTKKLDILSKEDNDKRILEFQSQTTEEYTCWSDIKKKNLKNILISDYALSLKVKYDLSLSDTKKLISMIYLGLLFKRIKPEHIVYRNSKVVDIINLVYTDGRFSIEDNQKSKPLYDKVTWAIEVPKRIALTDEWLNHLSTLLCY